jgi:hypothetical protein
MRNDCQKKICCTSHHREGKKGDTTLESHEVKIENGRQITAETENGKPIEGYCQEDKENNDSAP